MVKFSLFLARIYIFNDFMICSYVSIMGFCLCLKSALGFAIYWFFRLWVYYVVNLGFVYEILDFFSRVIINLLKHK